MAEYHEALWVVIGTGVPVLQLSTIVALGQLLAKLRDPRRPRPRRLTLQEKLGDDWRTATSPVGRTYLTVVIAVILNLVLFGIALLSLADERDVIHAFTGGEIMLISMLLVSIQVLQFETLRRNGL